MLKFSFSQPEMPPFIFPHFPKAFTWTSGLYYLPLSLCVISFTFHWTLFPPQGVLYFFFSNIFVHVLTGLFHLYSFGLLLYMIFTVTLNWDMKNIQHHHSDQWVGCFKTMLWRLHVVQLFFLLYNFLKVVTHIFFEIFSFFYAIHQYYSHFYLI